MNVDAVLLARQVLQSGGVNARLVTEVPSPAVTPLVRLRADGGGFVSSASPGWVSTPELQVDVWAADRETALTLAGLCRTVLQAAPRSDPAHAAGVLSRVEVGAPLELPDPEWRTAADRPMPRFLFIVRMVAHPSPPA